MATPTTPPIEEITVGDIGGSGIFDQLMEANAAHLTQEYELNRIRGAEYTKVYVASIQAIMQQAVAYALGWRESYNKGELIDAQIQKINAELLVLEQQASNEKLKGDLLQAQIEQEELKKPLIEAQTWAERAKTADDITLTDPSNPVVGLIGKQKEKLQNEVDLLEQKEKTELAQTSNIVDGSSVTGVIGKQKELFAAQTDGFARTAEQKLAKIMADTFSIRRTTDENLIAPGGLTDLDIKDVLNEAKIGIGAPAARG